MNGSIFKLTAIWVVRGWLMTSSCGVLAQLVIGSVTISPQSGVEVLPITHVPAVGTQCLRACQLMRSDGLAINRLRANVLPVTDPLFLKQSKWFTSDRRRPAASMSMALDDRSAATTGATGIQAKVGFFTKEKS